MVEHEQAGDTSEAENQAESNAQHTKFEIMLAGVSLILCRILGSLIRDSSKEE